LTLDFNHTAQSVEALDFARSQLSPGGTLLLTGLRPSFWIDFTFGARPGWTFSRHSARYWQTQMAKLGLVCGNPIELSPGDLSDIFVLAARRPGQEMSFQAPVTRESGAAGSF
jgi:phthiocerol/phenolphthiocerol synthesis type-I polyketide synthase C